MALMIAEVYDAFRAANVPEEQARKAAEAVAAYEPRFGALERTLRVLEWMVGFNLAMTAAILWRVLS
jgi:hypothetical protein